MRDNMNKVKVLALAMLVLPVFSSVALDMGGEWRVTGEGLEGVAKLPGTLGDAKLGKEHMPYKHRVGGSNPSSCTNGLLHPKQFYVEVRGSL